MKQYSRTEAALYTYHDRLRFFGDLQKITKLTSAMLYTEDSSRQVLGRSPRQLDLSKDEGEEGKSKCFIVGEARTQRPACLENLEISKKNSVDSVGPHQATGTSRRTMKRAHTHTHCTTAPPHTATRNSALLNAALPCLTRPRTARKRTIRNIWGRVRAAVAKANTLQKNEEHSTKNMERRRPQGNRSQTTKQDTAGSTLFGAIPREPRLQSKCVLSLPQPLVLKPNAATVKAPALNNVWCIMRKRKRTSLSGRQRLARKNKLQTTEPKFIGRSDTAAQGSARKHMCMDTHGQKR